MEKKIIVKLNKNFEDYAHRKDGVEFWFARDLQRLLGYEQWRNFYGVIQKSKISCKTAKNEILDHFVDVSKMVSIGSGSERKKSLIIPLEIIKSKIEFIKEFILEEKK